MYRRPPHLDESARAVSRRSVAPAFAIIVTASLLGASPVMAQVDRYAVVIGNNLGGSDESPLRWAEDDAAKIGRVLRDLGGLPAENLSLLRGENAEGVRRALIAVNDRIRVSPQAGARALLLVFFSGHADAGALHLGGTALDLGELRQLVRGSAAAVRLLVVDACRSGALTRVKGGREVPPFAIALDPGMTGEGAVFLTSSAANEDAQESDEIRGSFFTHYLASALQGAGDSDGDGRVVLEEAYRYAYENTLRATSRTLGGPQHPTFQYDLRGQGQIVLTTLDATPGSAHALLTLPAGKSYLVMNGDRAGAVLAEVGAHDRTRRLSVGAGRYFVRARGSGYLLEGTITLAAGEARTLDDRALERIDYARLVRKGRRESTLAHGPQAGYQLRSPLDGASFCHGVVAGYAFELPELTVIPRLAACQGDFENPDVRATTGELGAQVMVAHTWDLPVISVAAGVSLGASVLHQSFASQGVAPDRNSLAGHVGASAGVGYDLPRGFYLLADVTAASYLFRRQDTAGRESVSGALAVRASLALGKRL